MRTGILPPMTQTRDYGTVVEIDLDEALGPDACCTLKQAVGNRPICNQPAEWVVVLACCGHRKVVCDDHQDPTMSVWPRLFTCAGCKLPYPRVRACWPV